MKPEDILARPARFALFLDIDGTLLDLADRPDGVTLPPDLCATLRAVSDRLGGALALVTGRRIPWADQLFGHRFPIAGLHGFERRRADGHTDLIETPAGLETARSRLAPFAERHGLLFEDKGSAVALHFRNAPQHAAEADAMMEGAASDLGTAWSLQRGKMVIELRPAGASKGAAVAAFLTEPPFAGRLPVTIGDDVTDEAMFPVANDAGGLSIRIGDHAQPTAARGHLPTPADLRELLKRIAQWDA